MNISFKEKFKNLEIILFFGIVGLYYGQSFLIPIIISALFAFLFLPLSIRLENYIGRIPSIIICILIIIVILSGVITFLSSQIINIADDFPTLKTKAEEKFHSVIEFVESKTNISSDQQMNWLGNTYKNFFKGAGKWIESILLTFTDLLLTIGLIVVYIFCFIYYREKFYLFFLSLFIEERRAEVKGVMYRIKKLSGKYFSGVIIVMLILGTMHSIGLLLLGIEHALFLGYLAGFFIVVPFVGTMVGSLLPILMALLTKDSGWYAVGVVGIFSFNLFIESHILTPLIVGSHIQINPMIIIMGIILGGIIWGLAGMVLFIPLIGILKIVADNIEPLKPLSIILSNSSSSETKNNSSHKLLLHIKKVFKK